MFLDTISPTRGWYLSKITGSIKSSKRILVTSKDVIDRYNLRPGKFVKIKSLKNSGNQDHFIVLPYFKKIINHRYFFDKILNNIEDKRNLDRFNRKNIEEIRELINHFNKIMKNSENLIFNDLLLDNESNNYNSKKALKIGLPDFWLVKNRLCLGETVLLRNDYPSQKIF
ncbi:MAG: hypothetical protein GF329_08020 [Candidatus Lokiarchaeota archaeon]|nr:hypothetical protein [Candidatus Lokiarchaeota archaeon]